VAAWRGVAGCWLARGSVPGRSAAPPSSGRQPLALHYNYYVLIYAPSTRSHVLSSVRNDIHASSPAVIDLKHGVNGDLFVPVVV
jgi:hypothetical protein